MSIPLKYVAKIWFKMLANYKCFPKQIFDGLKSGSVANSLLTISVFRYHLYRCRLLLLAFRDIKFENIVRLTISSEQAL